MKAYTYQKYIEWTQSAAALGTYTKQLTNDVSAYMTLGYSYKNIYNFSVNARVISLTNLVAGRTRNFSRSGL
ncbi:MAG: hypothetical protein ACLTZT_02520 [Butyricimonas faecalis]